MGRNGKSRVSQACLVVCIVTGCCVGELYSQTITGTIVEGRSARPAVGVEVLASVGDTDTERTFSDDNGAFTMRLDDSPATRSSGRETVAITLTFS